jgi:hypothetical protein
MNAGQLSLLEWAVVIFFILLPLGYGIFLLIKIRDPAYSKSRAGYFMGFGIGFVLVAMSSGIQVFQGHQVPHGPGPWVDLIAEAAIGGVFFGAIGGLVNKLRRKRG